MLRSVAYEPSRCDQSLLAPISPHATQLAQICRNFPQQMSALALGRSPLAELFQQCSLSFKELYIALLSYERVSLSRFNDEYGRFGIWGKETGADRTGRGSLDDALRQDADTSALVAENLSNLDDDLKTCTELVKLKSKDQNEEASSSGYWLSDLESSSGSETGSDSSDVPEKTHQQILTLISIIVGDIQSLFQISTLLRRPMTSNKYLRSLPKNERGWSASHFMPFDLAHVAEKRNRWNEDPNSEQSASHLYGMTDYLTVRLATANVRRREQLYFWQEHPDRPLVIKEPTAAISLPLAETTGEANPESTQHIVTEAAPTLSSTSEMSKPSMSATLSFSAVAKSDLDDVFTVSGRPRTAYVPSVKGDGAILRVPDVPEALLGSSHFNCPYCRELLDTETLAQRDMWKRHVFRDLRVYVCTFERCQNPEKLYLTRNEWIYHETQMHRRRWKCSLCSGHIYNSPKELEEHLMATHAAIFKPLQLPTLITICERPADDTDDTECPLCPFKNSLSAVRSHLATHLEELALFVLPANLEDQSQEELEKSGVPKNESMEQHRTQNDIITQLAEGVRFSPDDVFIAVMGTTGSGKSTFVSHFVGERAKVGHDLASCTQKIEAFGFEYNKKRIVLVDTPGFDDTYRSDLEVLKDITFWLNTSYKAKIKLSGIIYLHPITNSRMTGSALKNLRMFQKLCGDKSLPSVVLATTCWAKVKKADGENREAQLKFLPEFWGNMIALGSQVFRLDNNRDSAMSIVSHILEQHRTTVVEIQHEMVDQAKTLDETAAGQELEGELAKQRDKFEQQLKEAREEMHQAALEGDRLAMAELEDETRRFQKQLDKATEASNQLKVSMEKLLEQKDAEYRQALRESETQRNQTMIQYKDVTSRMEELSKQMTLQDQQAENHRRTNQRELERLNTRYSMEIMESRMASQEQILESNLHHQRAKEEMQAELAEYSRQIESHAALLEHSRQEIVAQNYRVPSPALFAAAITTAVCNVM